MVFFDGLKVGINSLFLGFFGSCKIKTFVENVQLLSSGFCGRSSPKNLNDSQRIMYRKIKNPVKMQLFKNPGE
jgi:hypothetical protein